MHYKFAHFSGHFFSPLNGNNDKYSYFDSFRLVKQACASSSLTARSRRLNNLPIQLINGSVRKGGIYRLKAGQVDSLASAARSRYGCRTRMHAAERSTARVKSQDPLAH